MKFTPTIDGEAVRTETTQGVIDPATEEVFANCPVVSPAQLDRAMDAATRAFAPWRRDEPLRRRVLRESAGVLRQSVAELSTILSREQGKPVAKAAYEVHAAAAWFDAASAFPLEAEVLQEDDKKRVELRRVPLGVVGAITPWNFPLTLASWKLAFALLAGDTVVLKPSPYTPLSTLRTGELLRGVLPAGVLNVVAGDDDLGARITRHPAVRKVSFTGSVETGKKVAAAAAGNLSRVTLELGGNDAAIVLDDVDPRKVAEKIFWGAFENSGQICIAIKRLYVHEKVYGPLLAELLDLAARVKVGPGLEPTSLLGPINNRPQYERALELVEDARRIGAKVHSNPQPLPARGYFLAPTLITDVAEDARVMVEEQFAPILPVVPFSRVEDAVHRANATHFGLAGSVWTSDTKRGVEVAAHMECGTVWVNQVLDLSPTIPFGGWKWSGLGYENGKQGLDAFVALQVINVAKGV